MYSGHRCGILFARSDIACFVFSTNAVLSRDHFKVSTFDLIAPTTCVHFSIVACRSYIPTYVFATGEASLHVLLSSAADERRLDGVSKKKKTKKKTP